MRVTEDTITKMCLTSAISRLEYIFCVCGHREDVSTPAEAAEAWNKHMTDEHPNVTINRAGRFPPQIEGTVIGHDVWPTGYFPSTLGPIVHSQSSESEATVAGRAVVNEFGVVVPGSVVRKFDGTETTLTVTADQARELRDGLNLVLDFVDAQSKQD